MEQRLNGLRGRRAEGTDNGFTLIELLIVIVIIGVLAGIVVFAVSAFNGDGVAEACKTDIKSIEIAEEALYAKTGGFDTTADFSGLTSAGYLKEAPGTSKYVVTYNSTTKLATGALVAGGA